MKVVEFEVCPQKRVIQNLSTKLVDFLAEGIVLHLYCFSFSFEKRLHLKLIFLKFYCYCHIFKHVLSFLKDFPYHRLEKIKELKSFDSRSWI